MRVTDFSTVALVLAARSEGRRPHTLTFVLPSGVQVVRPVTHGVIKFNAGDVVRGRVVERILTDASQELIHTTVWLGAQLTSNDERQH